MGFSSNNIVVSNELILENDKLLSIQLHICTLEVKLYIHYYKFGENSV